VRETGEEKFGRQGYCEETTSENRARETRGRARETGEEKFGNDFESFPTAHLFPDLKASKRKRTGQITSAPIDASTKVFPFFFSIIILFVESWKFLLL
jgi:hypothetical protein